MFLIKKALFALFSSSFELVFVKTRSVLSIRGTTLRALRHFGFPFKQILFHKIEIKGDEIERWRNEFLKIRDEESMYVDYDLANDKLDRIEVYQSKEYMAHVASLVQTRMDERTTPKPISIWKEAKELTEIERQKTTQDLQTEREKSLEEHKMEATKFYRELLIFVEAKKLTKNDNVVELVCYIKNLLENGLPANRNIFFECFRFTGKFRLAIKRIF